MSDGDTSSPVSEVDPSPETPTAPALPSDAAGWRAFFASVPAGELFKAVQKEKASFTRVFTGFRPSADKLRHPLVLQRLADEALKQPKFVEAVSALPPLSGAALTPGPSPRLGRGVPDMAGTAAVATSSSLSPLPGLREGPGVRAAPDNGGRAEDPRLKDKIKEQRASLRDKETRIAELEVALAAARRERDTARTDADVAQAARKTAETEAERLRRQRERDARREEKTPAPAREKVRPSTVLQAVTTPAATSVWDEALGRLLSRGKYAVVADVCREALSGTGEAQTPAAARGRVHALYAAALYGRGNTAEGEEQDRLAVAVLLDGGNVPAAAESLARLLTFAPAPRAADVPLARRLFLLAEKQGQADAVRQVFTRMRIGSPEAYRRLRALLSGGGGQKVSASLVERLAPATAIGGATATVGPDEPVALPTLPAVTARRIVEAVDAGEADWVRKARAGMESLRGRGGSDAALADALLEAVAALEPVAVQPLLQPVLRPVVVDASNVARHNPDPLSLARSPRLIRLKEMRDFLLRRGYFPVHLIADATLRFHVDDRAAYEDMLRRHMVRETPPGTSADETLIREAKSLPAPLVTNDRLAEWGDAAFSVERRGFALVPGGVTLTDF